MGPFKNKSFFLSEFEDANKKTYIHSSKTVLFIKSTDYEPQKDASNNRLKGCSWLRWNLQISKANVQPIYMFANE